MMENPPLSLADVLEQEYAELHPEAPMVIDRRVSSSERLAAIHKVLHNSRDPHAALCLSGGGIRSATFGLGVLQGLAKAGLLEKFHYLSTVSGGGFIGSWLSGWLHRSAGMAEVTDELNSTTQSQREEADTLKHLRSYSNYLTPRLGLMSADTWSLVGTVLRNLLLNWLVLIPMMMAAVSLPALYAALAALPPSEPWRLLVAFAGSSLAALAIAYVGLYRPSLHIHRLQNAKLAKRSGQSSFLMLCLGPLLVSAFLMTLYKFWLVKQPDPSEPTWLAGWQAFIVFATVVNLFAWGLYSFRLRIINWREALVVTVCSALGGVAVWGMLEGLGPGSPLAACLSQWLEGHRPGPGFYTCLVTPSMERLGLDPRLYACLAPPAGLLAFLLGATLFVGLMSHETTDEDREWWARFGGWVLVMALGWVLISALVLFQNELSLLMGMWIHALGGVSGILTYLLGKSPKTAAKAGGQTDLAAQSGFAALKSKFPAGTIKLALPIFMLALVIWLGWAVSAAAAQVQPLIAVDDPALARLISLIITVLVLLAISSLFSFSINVNKFSLHAMYRNRLIRAYLGASNEARDPNPFTGFDAADNIQMFELQRGMFCPRHVRDELTLAQRWLAAAEEVKEGDKISTLLFNQLLQRRILLQKFIAEQREAPGPEARARLKRCVCDHLNDCLAQWAREGKALEPDGALGTGNGSPADLILANRRQIEAQYGELLDPATPRRPLHVVNCALNLVSGKRLAWQQRMAQNFTVTALHAGSEPGIGYRHSFAYGGERGISLGTAVAISGAAVSPNMGYHSSAIVTFLLTLFNARLGWWLGNPRVRDPGIYRRSAPSYAMWPMLAELFGLTDESHAHVYLSDGGHFENLALYEMVRRRCRHIVVSDAGCDPIPSSYQDLGGAVRKIRVDLGIPITFASRTVLPGLTPGTKVFCAVGDIDYSAADGTDGDKVEPGILIYLKPCLNGDEPVDVFNYWRENPVFPHEPTADQWFSEAQFESYRALGRHVIDSICGPGWNAAGGLPAFEERARKASDQAVSSSSGER